MCVKKQNASYLAPIEVEIPRFWAGIVTESGTITPNNAKSYCSKIKNEIYEKCFMITKFRVQQCVSIFHSKLND
jgi:hypothetical protein